MLHICEAPAGVAHLVERHLAKVEVASSSLVFRSKKPIHPFGVGRFFCNDEVRKGRSEHGSDFNSPGDC